MIDAQHDEIALAEEPQSVHGTSARSPVTSKLVFQHILYCRLCLDASIDTAHFAVLEIHISVIAGYNLNLGNGRG